MSTLNVDKVDPSTGTALEIGSSGDTITIPSGATIVNSGTATGFGVSLANGVDNRVVTSSSATALNGETNLIYNGTILGAGADGANADLGVGLHIKTADSGAGVLAGADELIIEGSGDNGISILTGTGSTSRICFGDSGGANQGIIDYSHGTDAMLFKTADTTRLTLTSTGRGKSAFTGLAWAHFDGTGTPSINASHNVADLTDSETGQIRVNFTASLADANYAAVVNSWWGYAYTGGAMDIYTDGFKATTSNGSSYTDVNSIMISVFGNA